MSQEGSMLDGRVELRELLGQGGMGEVHAAWDAGLQRPVAVKFVRGDGARDAERLLLEARLQARVEHPHVVRVFEVGTLQGRPCIVLQLVRGKTLAEAAAALPLAQRVELVRQAATGLHAAHLQGLVHRDVKPGNVLVEEREDGAPQALVTDFGLAHAEEGGLTRSGLVPGTLDYMAPEQLAGGGPVDFRSDVHALGATLYAVLAGRPPFRGPSGRPDPGSDAQLLLVRRILEEEPPPLRRLAPDAPWELALVAARAMEKDPAARYPTAEAFAEDLARYQRGEPVLARAPGPVERALKWARRNPTASRALGVVVAVLLAGVVLAAWQARRGARQALEAARLGAEAEQLDQAMRVQLLLPAHDLSPAYAQVREAVDRSRGGAPGAAAASAAFALGRGLQLLGDHAGAYPSLQRAWELGLRRAPVARALAEAEGRLYARDRMAMGRLDDPEQKRARLAELAHRYRDPAAERLADLAAASEADRQLLGARLALVEQRFEDAAQGARAAGAAGADPLEASELEGEALFLGGNDLRERGDAAGARTRLTLAAAALQRAAAIGRSAPGPRLLLARVHVIEYDLAANEAGFRLPPLDAIGRELEEAQALDPRGAEVHNVWVGVQSRRGDALSAAGLDPLPAYRAAVAHGERGVEASPSDPLVSLLQLANACHSLGLVLGDGAGDPRPVYQQGIAAAERAQALAPATSGPVFNLAQLHASRADWLGRHGQDARPAAEAAVAAGRRFLAAGDRPVVARVVLAKALEALSGARLAWGEDGAPALAEGLRLVQEGFRLAPRHWGILEKGLSLAVTATDLALSEGRSPEAALDAGTPWAEAILPLTEGNRVFAADLGAFHLARARAELAAGRDPSAWLDQALPLLRESARLNATARGLVGEVALTRARWAARRGKDPRPALEAGGLDAAAARKLDPGDGEAPLLQARLLLALPRPTAAERATLREALDRALALNPRDGRAWLADAQARQAAGELALARASLARATEVRPRLEGLAELRVALGP